MDKVGAALVIGGGISGMQAALDLADAGIKAYLIEKRGYVGGNMAKLDKTFPTNDCAMCTINPRLVSIAKHENVKMIFGADLHELTGEKGNFTAKIKQKARYINNDRCTGCSLCAEVCPVSIDSDYEFGLAKKKAAYKDYPQAVPSTYAIEKRNPAPCKKFCPYDISVQGIIALASQGQYKEAYDLILNSMPLPGFCFELCSNPCETKCRKGAFDSVIQIRALKKYLKSLFDGKDHEVEKIEKLKQEKKVAVIGSASTGIFAAFKLKADGYDVDVISKSDSFMDDILADSAFDENAKSILQADIENLKKEFSVNVKSDIDPEKLLTQGYDYVVVTEDLGSYKTDDPDYKTDNEKIFSTVKSSSERAIWPEGSSGSLSDAQEGFNVALSVVRNTQDRQVEDKKLTNKAEVKPAGGDLASYDEESAKEESLRCLNCAICSECNECLKVCKVYAIEHDMPKEVIEELKVGSVVVSSGFDLYDADKKKEFGHERFDNVLSSLEFERMLNASGPFKGHIQRISDGKDPKKIAWIQCVGSREEENPFCSAVCCMYATKETIIAKDHIPDLECHIFYIDIRAFSKGFEEYYNRAKSIGVKYTRCRPSELKEDPITKNVIIKYQNEETGYITFEEFDMVVLSCGIQPQREAKILSKKLGIDVNELGFVKSEKYTPLETSVDGIYACGMVLEPKDIPDSVTQASGAATKALVALSEVKGQLITKKEYPPERDVSAEEPRIGVFVCHCGRNISGVIDTTAVADFAAGLKNVVYTTEALYACASDAQEVIKEAMIREGLNRVVIAACTPRTHEPLFQDMLQEGGINPFYFELANIRDQCSWVHQSEPEAATEKAKKIVKMSVDRTRLLKPLYKEEYGLNHTALVIGGGVAGMNGAINFANQGYKVNLIELSDSLGGNAKNIHYTVEGADPKEYLNNLIKRVEDSDNINIRFNTEVTNTSGYLGNFVVEVASSGGDKEDIDAGVILVAVGGSEYQGEDYQFGSDGRVITQRELESRIATDKTKLEGANTFVMIQCVGSRNEEFAGCSRICCTNAVKNAIKIKETTPEKNVYVLYRDIRTYGFREQYYTKARELGVIFMRFDENEPPQVNSEKDLSVTVKDQMLGQNINIKTDLVVLSMGVRPAPDSEKLSKVLKIPLDSLGFFLEAHMKLRPVEFGADGIYLAGLAHFPKFIDESISQASAAVAKGTSILAKETLSLGGIISVVDTERCVACLTCVRMCPYNVPRIIDGVANILPSQCQGCGICASECPAKAIQLQHYTDEQMIAKCEGFILEEDAP
jgi:heterodisulfide reductase subunit A-like polyferredoxin